MSADLTKALLAAMAEMANPTKTATATIQAGKGGYSYDYETLADVLAIVKPALQRNGLILHQQTAPTKEGTFMVTSVILAETAEEKVLDFTPLTVSADARAMGSAITYARRYSLKTAFALAGEDDDGEAASTQVSPKAARERTDALERRMLALLRQAKESGQDMDSISAEVKAATGKKSTEYKAEDYLAAVRILEQRLGVSHG